MPSVFVSYAHVDNQPVSSETQGWISHFVNNLRIEVDRRLGRLGDFDLWMDFRLKSNDDVTPEIKKQLDEAHILLLFFSAGWRKSPWCPQELEWFARAPEKCHAGRIFLVEMDGLKLQDRPPILQDALGARFWEKTGQDRVRNLGYPVPNPNWCDPKPYFDELLKLADALAEKLAQPLKPTPAVAIKATVYLAPVHDALHASRESVAVELRQFGIASLPVANALDIAGFKDAMREDLAACSHFIQLLDADRNMGLPAAQAKIAKDLGKPMLQWHERGLDKAKADKEQLKLLEGPQVITCTLSEFTAQVRDAVFPKPPGPTPAGDGKSLVFVHTSPPDLDLAKKIADRLQAHGHGIALPRYQGEPAAIRGTIEKYLKLCTALLIVQRDTPDDVVEDYLADALIHSNSLETPLPIAVCRTLGAEALQFCPATLHVCPCQAEFDWHCVEQFLRVVAR